MKHGATVMSAGRNGCWATCTCGWRSGVWKFASGASYAFAEHVREASEDTATT